MSETPREADARAIASDWAAVDNDMAVAARKIANEQEKEAKQSR